VTPRIAGAYRSRAVCPRVVTAACLPLWPRGCVAIEHSPRFCAMSLPRPEASQGMISRLAVRVVPIGHTTNRASRPMKRPQAGTPPSCTGQSSIMIQRRSANGYHLMDANAISNQADIETLHDGFRASAA
jgi:hypothetical protein